MSDEWAKKFYDRLWWVAFWLYIIAMNTCDIGHIAEGLKK